MTKIGVVDTLIQMFPQARRVADLFDFGGFFPSPVHTYSRSPNAYRARRKGKANPAGTKLLKKANKQAFGVRHP